MSYNLEHQMATCWETICEHGNQKLSKCSQLRDSAAESRHIRRTEAVVEAEHRLDK